MKWCVLNKWWKSTTQTCFLLSENQNERGEKLNGDLFGSHRAPRLWCTWCKDPEERDSFEKKKKEPSRKKSSPNFPSILWLESEPGCESVVSETDLRSGHRCTLVLYSQQPSFSGDLRAPVFFFLRKLRVDRPGDNGRGLDTFSSHSKDSVLYFE